MPRPTPLFIAPQGQRVRVPAERKAGAAVASDGKRKGRCRPARLRPSAHGAELHRVRSRAGVVVAAVAARVAAENHLAWFVIDAVEAMDLAAFYAVYRQDGHG